MAEKIRAAQRKQATAARHAREGGLDRQIAENPCRSLAAGILHQTAKAAEADAAVDDEIARLRGRREQRGDRAGARGLPRVLEIACGVLEADYLSGFKDARVVAPNELYEMAQLGARYRTSLRNSGLSASGYDVGNVMRMMDELGLKTQAERERFLNATLKTQRAFGSHNFDRDHALRVP